MLKVFYQAVKSDLRVILRKRSTWVIPAIFLIIFISLFGIGLGFDHQQLKNASPAIIWIAFLLTSLFTIEALFRTDEEEGTLETLLLSPYPLWWLLLAKAVAFWLAACLPLILLMPLLGLFMQLSSFESIILVVSLLLGSPALILVGLIGAALTVVLENAGILLGLLLLPLYIPILILGESAVVCVTSAQPAVFQLTLLAALSVLAITLAPHAASAALKVATE